MAVRLQSNAVTSGPTKNNVSALMPEMTLSFTLAKTVPIFVFFSGTFSNSNSDQGGIFRCLVDGQSDVQMQRQFAAQADAKTVVSMQKILYLTPGNHTIAIWWAATANTLTAVGIERILTVLEEEL
jgi:hypothetical protein